MTFSTLGHVRWLHRAGTIGFAAGLALLLGGYDRSPASISPQWAQETAHAYPAQVSRSDLNKLGTAWEFDDFVVRGQTHRGVEATPTVVDGVMYTTGPWSVVYALDARTGKLLWQYDPEVDGQFARHTCCDAVNRGVAVAFGTVYVGTLDGYLSAVNAKTGKQLWKVDTIVNRQMSYAITGAPRVAGNNVLIGNGGAEMGARGYASAYNLKTGKLAWRFFVVPGDPAKSDENPELVAARKTWSPQSTWKLGGGGTPWDSIVYDPETNVVFVGTGNGMPHPVWSRSPGGGDNLFLSSILAIDADTGRLKWHYQTTPGDSWDYTATQNMILANLAIDGKPRKVILQAPKNGFFYVLDRNTGELLSAEKYTTATWADHVDLKTGRPVITEQGDFSKAPKIVWPSEAGGHNWQPMAFSEKTKLVYIPVLEAPMAFQMHEMPYRPYSNLQGSIAQFVPPDTLTAAGQPKPTFQSVLKAWNPISQKVVWVSKPMAFYSGGAMALDDGIVAQGSADGYLTFYDGVDGTILKRIELGTSIMASPMAYKIDGQLYVAVAAGFGGAPNVSYPPGSAAVERMNFERLVVFKVGGTPPKLPPLRPILPFLPAPVAYRGDAVAVTRGAALYVQNCGRCHGGPDTIGGYPNLWKMVPETHAAFTEIVSGGAYAYAGMASFGDVLTPKDVADIHAFLSQPTSNTAPTPKGLH